MKPPTDTASGSAVQPSQIEKALSRLARQATEAAAAFRFALYAAIVLPPGLLIFRAVEYADYRAFSTACCISLLLLAAALLYDRLLRRSLRRELAACDIYLRLALDGLDHDRIFERMPWPWRSRLPRNRSGSLLPTLRRIASNLDYYLYAGLRAVILRRLLLSLTLVALMWLALKPLWMAYALWPLVQQLLQHGIISTTHIASSSRQVLSLVRLLLPSGIACAGLGLLLVFQVYRRQVWTEEFVEYMRAHLRG